LGTGLGLGAPDSVALLKFVCSGFSLVVALVKCWVVIVIVVGVVGVVVGVEWELEIVVVVGIRMVCYFGIVA